jgi:heme exporter protein D
MINLFLLGCETFKEFYTDSQHVASAQYLFFGLHGHNALVPWIWSAIGMEFIAAIILLVPPLARRLPCWRWPARCLSLASG